MGKDKLRKYAEINTFHNVIQPHTNTILKQDHLLKGKWSSQYFKNDHPITLELGCGKGEYVVNLAEKYSNRNFIGIDIKGARIWRGAKTSIERKINNVAFLRTHIEVINRFFSPDDNITEIWITFPDPFLKRTRAKKRLTSSRFLSIYSQILPPQATINLKTDSIELFNYTLELIQFNKLPLLNCTKDLYNSNLLSNALNIKTFYEQQYLEQNKTIKYAQFELNGKNTFQEPEKKIVIKKIKEYGE